MQMALQALPDLGEIFYERAAGHPCEAPVQHSRPANADCVTCACGRRVVSGHLSCLVI